MATVIFTPSIELVDKVETKLGKESLDSAWLAVTADITEALEKARFKLVMDLRSTADPVHFQDFSLLITRTRDVVYRIIQERGSVADDRAPVERSRELLDALESHIVLGNHVKSLTGQPTSIGADLKELKSSMGEIIAFLDAYCSAVQQLFSKYRR